MRETKLGTPPKKLGKIFEWPLKKFTLWGDYSPRKGEITAIFLRLCGLKARIFFKCP